MRIILATAVLFLAACDRSPPEPQVTVEAAVVQLSPIPGRPAAAYFQAEATSKPEAIIAISSPRAERIEMHQSMSGGGMSGMQALASAPFDEEGRLTFEPGGKHLMVFGIDPAVRPGDRMTLRFTFAKAPPVTVEASVRAIGAPQ